MHEVRTDTAAAEAVELASEAVREAMETARASRTASAVASAQAALRELTERQAAQHGGVDRDEQLLRWEETDTRADEIAELHYELWRMR